MEDQNRKSQDHRLARDLIQMDAYFSPVGRKGLYAAYREIKQQAESVEVTG